MIDHSGCQRGRGGGALLDPLAASAIKSAKDMIYSGGCRRGGGEGDRSRSSEASKAIKRSSDRAIEQSSDQAID